MKRLILNWVRAKFRRPESKQGTRYFLDRLEEEARRSLRYNHFFSLVILRCRRTSPQVVYGRVRPELRSTDIVEVIGYGDDGHAREGRGQADSATQAGRADGGKRVAVILPETDGEGAKTAVGRLKSVLLNHQENHVKIASAVYPADSTAPGELLRLADPMDS